MKIAYFDTVSGIAGDMTMAAFVSAGLPIEILSGELGKLGIGGFELLARHVQRSSISAVQLDVAVSHDEHHHRHLHHVEAIILGSTLSADVKDRALSIYRVIAEAEAKVHATTLERVHLHEVGALDSIIDVVGAAICLEQLGIERVYSSPVRLGSGGTVTTEHGIMPTPAPATLEILKGYPTVLTRHPYELTTPTGAAIIKALSSGVLEQDIFRTWSIGYGAGTKEFQDLPNFLRIIIAELGGPSETDDIVVIETNIDDMNPQIYPYLIERLLASGAHDAYLVPIIMKKGRPGILLSTMVERRKLDTIIETIYQQTTTIGLRVQSIGRLKLPRRQREVQTPFGIVKAKVVIRNGKEMLTPEYEECKRIAMERNLPLLEVMRLLERALGVPGITE
jgi:uncharacterized protein (TIGR00299 family) protein